VNDKVADNIFLLEQLVLAVIRQGKLVAASTDKEVDLIEELQQIAAALHFTTQSLKHRMGLSVIQPADTDSIIVIPGPVNRVECPPVNTIT
jgi:hypothetical protein